MNGLINDFQEITCERDQLFKVFAEKKLKYMDVKDDKTITDKQNRCLKKHVETHESSNLDIKSEILKTTITGKGKGKMRKLRKTLEKSLKDAKVIISLKNGKVRKLTTEIFQIREILIGLIYGLTHPKLSIN